MARKDFRVIELFQKYRIDFYCNGDRTLQEAIGELEGRAEELLTELAAINVTEQSILFIVDVEQWPLDLLADYIQKTHHKFTDKILTEIRTLIEEIVQQDLPEVGIVNKIKGPFDSLAKELGAHMKKEELILFPAIKRVLINLSWNQGG